MVVTTHEEPAQPGGPVSTGAAAPRDDGRPSTHESGANRGVSPASTAVDASFDGAVHVAVRDAPLSLDPLLAHVGRRAVGGVVTFTGLVRDHAGGRGVVSLDYSAHPLALSRLRALAEELADRDGVVAVAAEHRTGHLVVGDVAVVLAVGAHHRGQAFDCCRELIDRLKAEVPIWKHQVFDDGDDEWVGTP